MVSRSGSGTVSSVAAVLLAGIDATIAKNARLQVHPQAVRYRLPSRQAAAIL